MNPANNSQYGSFNPAAPSQESYVMHNTPQQNIQQQFPHQGFSMHNPQSTPTSTNPGHQQNIPRMMGTWGHQPSPSPSSVMQQPGSNSALPVGGIQYFMDAACTVPAGTLPHQPQTLNHFSPHQQQRLLMSQANQPLPPQSSSAQSSLVKQSQCLNPNCTHCCKPQTAPAGLNSRRS